MEIQLSCYLFFIVLVEMSLVSMSTMPFQKVDSLSTYVERMYTKIFSEIQVVIYFYRTNCTCMHTTWRNLHCNHNILSNKIFPVWLMYWPFDKCGCYNIITCILLKIVIIPSSAMQILRLSFLFLRLGGWTLHGIIHKHSMSPDIH